MLMDAGLSGLQQDARGQGGRGKKLIEGGDGEANYAYYALHKLHILPSVFLEMDEEEKAFVIAAIRIRTENDKKKKQEIERKSNMKGR